jgi:GTP-binding protein
MGSYSRAVYIPSGRVRVNFLTQITVNVGYSPQIMLNPFQQARFQISVPDPATLPDDNGLEIAFAGRSNAGKSSALNAITGQKALARTSKTPGRTQHIVVFELDQDHRLIDLPGYGYAKVSRKIIQKWQHALNLYLTTRQSLGGLVLMSDSRHPLKDADLQMLDWCHEANMPVHVLLTKADKLSRGQAHSTWHQCDKLLKDRYAQVSSQLFSSKSGTGLDQARQFLHHWLYPDKDPLETAEK